MKDIKYFKKTRVWFYYLRRDLNRFLILRKILAFGKTEVGLISYKDEINYLKNNGLVIFPYPFEKTYNNNSVIIIRNHDLPYVDFSGEKMFFQRNHTDDHIKYYLNSILMEQDLKSPHRYCTIDFDVGEGDVLVDLGVAEGNFSLLNIDKARRVFLFESNPKWIEVLEETFNPFAEKVVILNKIVSDTSVNDKIALDDVSELIGENLFIKIDVDGMERPVLKGMSKLLSNSKCIKVAICTYHKQNDSIEFEAFFNKLGFKTEFSPGVMLFYHDKKLMSPYFRKGVLRAWKVS